jgi:hypothetical protein
MTSRREIPKGVDPDLMNYVREASRNVVRDAKSGRWMRIDVSHHKSASTTGRRISDQRTGGRKKA